jgi:hypothetical protein
MPAERWTKEAVMKYLKMLVLAAVAPSALMAFFGAGTASATKLCSTTVDPCPAGQHWPAGTEIDLSLVPEGSSLETDTQGNRIETCTVSTVKVKTTTTGSTSETVKGNITSLLWEGCGSPTKTIKMGSLEIHKIAGTSNGTLTASTITEVTSSSFFFGSCVYGVTSGVSVGDLTEGKGSTAILHVNTIKHKFSGSNFACPETTRWTATYQLTSPSSTTLSVTAG